MIKHLLRRQEGDAVSGGQGGLLRFRTENSRADGKEKALRIRNFKDFYTGIYYGAQYGGSTTSILVNLPGESSSIVTCIDGYQMARNGRAGAALTISALGSFFAGTIATMVVAGFAPPLSELALTFGPAEYFSLMVLGLIGAVVLAHGSLIKAVGMIILGLLLGMVGMDVNSGNSRGRC